MMVTKTPLRVSLFGGGTDFPDYFEEHGGRVLSGGIDKGIYVIVKQRFDGRIRVGYTQTELVDHIDELEHELIREAMRMTAVCGGVEIATMADIPSEGSGLGSSSTVTVGVLHALHLFAGRQVSAAQLAHEAVQIECEVLGKPIGWQDQYAAAYGGFHLMDFLPGRGRAVLTAVPAPPGTLEHLSDNLLLFFTGVTRKADAILVQQIEARPSTLDIMAGMKGLVRTAFANLAQGKVAAIGPLLHEGWKLKKQLAGVSNWQIDLMYEAARQAGATGGKLCGAGGGGFLLLYVPSERQTAVREALAFAQELPFRLGAVGSRAVFDGR
jgi:D-glycero-alpha-D-manno-heptose-7-phosphate kinase